MKRKIIISVAVAIAIAIYGKFTYQMGQKSNAEVIKIDKKSIEKIEKKAENEETFYYDNTWYHKINTCKNRDGFVRGDKFPKKFLKSQGKKPCTQCIPEEQER